jgi:signal transduction histidine kinase
MTHEDDVYFNIDSRLLLQLGEKLVTNRAVALAELVKNSYDADATHVLVSLANIRNPGGTIIVEDNGSGMSLSIFKKTWMRIATIDKENNPISQKYKRQKSGEKGIGRFACRSLSTNLKIKSVAVTEEGHKEELNAFFDWTAFTPGSDVDKIPVKYSTKPVGDNTPTGTTLTLGDAKEYWTAWDVRRLRNELTDLISPTTFHSGEEIKHVSDEYDPGFKIEFDCTEFPTKEERLDESFLKNAWAKLSGNVDENGIATYEIKVLNKVLNNISKSHTRTESFQYLRNSKLEISFFVYMSPFFKGSEWVSSKAAEIGRKRGGVKVYADNFRVFGYGEKGDDWLKVDSDRGRSKTGVYEEVSDYLEVDDRPGLRLFMNRALFGHVMFLKNSNPMLEIAVNRERLINNGSFEELKKFVRLGVDFATVLYANEVTKKIELEDRAKEAKEEERRKADEIAGKRLEEALKNEKERLKVEEEARRIEDARRRKEEEIRLKAEGERKRAEEIRLVEFEELRKNEDELRKLKDEEFKRKDEKYERESLQLRVLASTGTLVLILNHELQALVDAMEEMDENFSSIIQKMPDDERLFHEVIQKSFSNRIEMVKEFGHFVGLTVGGESRLEKKEWVISPIAESVFRPFKWYLHEFGIDYDITLPDNLRTLKMYRSELVSVLFNLLSNAIKAIKGTNDRRIEVTGFEGDNFIHILFLDSGKGLDKNLREIVFEPFETYSEPDFKFGIGTGLGLKIVRDIIKSYDGNVQFIDPPDSWKTCVEIILPKRD